MEMALEMSGFGFTELSQNEMEMVDGGASVAGIICSSLAIVAGGAVIVGCILCPPVAVAAAVCTYVAGGATVLGGVAGIFWSCGY